MAGAQRCEDVFAVGDSEVTDGQLVQLRRFRRVLFGTTVVGYAMFRAFLRDVCDRRVELEHLSRGEASIALDCLRDMAARREDH